MKRQTAIQTPKQTLPLQTRGLLPHAAVRATPDHDVFSNSSVGSRFGHDFSQVVTRPLAPIVSQGYSNVSSSPRIQAKLKIGQPGDKYEQEADQVAEQVMQMPDPRLSSSVGDSLGANSVNPDEGTIQRICAPCSTEYKAAENENRSVEPANLYPKCKTQEGGGLIQTKAAGVATPEVTPEISSSIQSLQGGGRPLSGMERNFFEPRFGADFSGVRVHNDARAAGVARSVNARAFTLGRDVVFGAGEYSPDSFSGRKLFAHELVHVGQQNHIQRGPAPLIAHLQRREQQEGEMMPMSVAEFRDEVIITTLALITANAPTLGPALRRTLEGPTEVPSLVALLDQAQRRSVGQRHSEQLDSITAIAALLVQTFILDPNTSSLDLLPEVQRDRVRNFNWEEQDYPGGITGTNESRARQMSQRLSVIRPERRANSDADAVVTRAQHTSAVKQHIRANLIAIPAFPAPAGGGTAPDQRTGHQLYRNAQTAFMNMRVAALQDGVPLIVLSSYRDPAVAEARARAAGNPAAVASFSSHSLGLAVDLKMSFSYEDESGRQQNVQFAETTTTPMQNVIDMRESPVHKWIFLYGAEHGWFPYQNEPWHWEYNPEGFRDQFNASLNPPQP